MIEARLKLPMVLKSNGPMVLPACSLVDYFNKTEFMTVVMFP
jgi:hypothetical protein